MCYISSKYKHFLTCIHYYTSWKNIFTFVSFHSTLPHSSVPCNGNWSFQGYKWCNCNSSGFIRFLSTCPWHFLFVKWLHWLSHLLGSPPAPPKLLVFLSVPILNFFSFLPLISWYPCYQFFGFIFDFNEVVSRIYMLQYNTNQYTYNFMSLSPLAQTDILLWKSRWKLQLLIYHVTVFLMGVNILLAAQEQNF